MQWLPLLLTLSLATALDGWAGTVTYTGPGGKTTTSNRTRTAPGSFQRTNTFPQGQTSTYNGNFQGQGNGNYTGTIDRNGPKGKAQTYQVNGNRQRSGNTITNQGTVTNQNGQEGTFNRQHTCTARSCQGTNTYQTTRGQTHTKTSNGSCENGTCTKSSTIVNPAGKTTIVDTTADRVEKGTYTGTTTITTSQGQVKTGTFQRTPNP